MTKIAIISQPEQGVLIDVGGCSSLQEATQHLTCTLQVSSQFWEDQPVDLNLGNLSLAREELAQIFATLNEVGVRPRHVFARAAATKAALRALNVVPAPGAPASLPGEAGSEPAATAGGGSQSAAEIQPCAATQTASCQTPGDSDSRTPATTVSSAAGVSGDAEGLRADEPTIQADRETIPVEVDGTISGALPEAPARLETPASTGAGIGAVHGAATADAGECPAQGAGGPAEAGRRAEAAEPARPAPAHVMYLRQTLRSGQAISHKGHLVIIGDVNPGAEVIAEGDITVWGALRGIAHAGVGGNWQAEIRALRFDPIQLRIAHAIARSPDRPRGGQKYNGPETARIVNGTIRIASSAPE